MKKPASQVQRGDTTVEPSNVRPSSPHHLPPPSQTRLLTMPQHGGSLLRFLNEDRSRQQFCDVSVSVGGKVYSAHRAVLAHGSSYFHAELSRSSGATTQVTLDHVEDWVFQLLLGFLYTAECLVAERDLPALTKAAQFLDMMDILKLVCVEEKAEAAQGKSTSPVDMTRPADVGVISSVSVEATVETDPDALHSSGLESELSAHQLSSEMTPRVREGEITTDKGVATRRSARRRRTPSKYKREEPQGKHREPSPKRKEESREGDEGGGEGERELLLVRRDAAPQQTTGSGEKLEFAEDEAKRETGGRTAQDGETNKSTGEEEEEEEDEDEGDASERPAEGSGSSDCTLAYPEGLAPVVIQSASKKTLKCPKCDKTFDRAGKYESHTRVHTGEKPFQCDVCLQCYSTKSNLTVHKKKHAGDASFPRKEHKCPFCSKLHASKKTLAKHIRRFHSDCAQEFFDKKRRKSSSWECSICSKSFSRKPHLQEHMILHTQDRPFKCSFCEEYFKSRFARLKHQEKFHLGPFPCEICGRQFNDSGNKKRHIECTHGGTRKWTCFICGKSVRERTTLREHLRIHTGEKPHFCSVCGQSFRHSSSYRLHLRVHRDDKRYECDECGKSFIRHDHLTKHQKIHSGEKTHQCEECGKCFRRHDHLTVHYKSVHLGEKVWQKYKTALHQCEICKKEFKGKSSLEMHFRTHSGEKPHRCPECHQTFRIKKTLTKHMVIHSDARPFNCPHCSATFKRKDKLKYHVDHVHSTRSAEPAAGQDKALPTPFKVKPGPNSPPAPANVCIPVTLVPVPMTAGPQGDVHPHRPPPQSYSVVSGPAQAPQQQQQQQQSAPYQHSADLAFLEKYTLTPQPANIVHPVRPEQMLDPRDQSYLGTLLGLDSTSLVQNIPNSEGAH